MRRCTSLLVALLAGALFAAPAIAQMHTAAITQIAVDRAESTIATISSDKTVRLWSLPSGQLKRVISLPENAGGPGAVLSLAISPDGKMLALGGQVGKKNPRTVEGLVRYDYEIHLHDTASGTRLRALDVPAMVDQLAWSPTGDLLIAAASSMVGAELPKDAVPVRALSVYRTGDDRASADVPPYFAAVAAADAAGRLFVVGKPGGSFVAELYGPGFIALETRRFRGDPAAAAFAPDGASVAVATFYGALTVHSLRDLSVLYAPDLSDLVRDPDSPRRATIAWSTDGRYLYFASAALCSDRGCAIRRWSDAGRGAYRDIVVSTHPVTHLVGLRGGGVAFGSARPSFGVLDGDGNIVMRHQADSRATPLPQPAATSAPASPATKAMPRVSDAGPDIDVLHERVTTLLGQFRPQLALEPARAAFERTKQFSRDDPAAIGPKADLGRTLYAIGCYRHIGDSPGRRSRDEHYEARPLLESALAAAEHHHRVSEAAAIVDTLSDLLAEDRDFDSAMDAKRRSIALHTLEGSAGAARAAKASNDVELLRVRKLLAPDRADLYKALPLALAQLRDAQQQLGAKNANVAAGLDNLASVYRRSQLGLRDASLRLREQALAMYRKELGADHCDTVKAAAVLAQETLESSEPSAALRGFESIEASLTQALGADHESVADLVGTRAQALQRTGQHDQAVPLLLRIRDFWQLRLGPTSGLRPVLESRRTAQQLGDAYAALAKPGLAQEQYAYVLDGHDRGVVMKPFMVARVRVKLAAALQALGDFEEARAQLKQARALVAPDLTPPGTLRWSIVDAIERDALEAWSAIARAANDTADARKHLLQAAAIDDHIFGVLLWPQSAAESVTDTQEMGWVGFMHRYVAVTARYDSDDAPSIKRALDLVLNRKGIAFELEAHRRRMISQLPERARLAEQELQRARRAFSLHLLSRPAEASAEEDQQLVLAFERCVELESRVTNALLARESFVALPAITSEQVAAGLPPNTVLVEYLRVSRTPERYIAFVLDGQGSPRLHDLGDAKAIDELVSDLQESLRRDSAPALVQSLLRQLHDLVWLPLGKRVAGSPQVLVSPDGELYRVPFAALLDATGRHVIEQQRVAYVISGRDVVPGLRPAPAGASLDLALLADPDYTARHAGPSYDIRFSPLPGTGAEARSIPPLVTGSLGQVVLTGPMATGTALLALRSPRVLHIASHGIHLTRDMTGIDASGYEPSLARSGLVLTADEQTGGQGIVTALELSGMDLRGTELVVLSACDTGAGSVTKGQGLLGLRRAFALAGAKNLLLSLWPVDDAATVSLMEHFYRRVSRLSPADALREAQLELIRGARARGEKDVATRLWAPFILQGVSPFGQP